MTRRDYVAIASALAEGLATCERQAEELGDSGNWTHGHLAGTAYGLLKAADLIADVLAADNPRFSRERFLAAVKS